MFFLRRKTTNTLIAIWAISLGLMINSETSPFPLWFNFDTQSVPSEFAKPVETSSAWGLIKYGATVGCGIGLYVGVVKAQKWYQRFMLRRDIQRRAEEESLKRRLLESLHHAKNNVLEENIASFQQFVREAGSPRLCSLLKYQNTIERAGWREKFRLWGLEAEWAFKQKSKLYCQFMDRVAQAEYDVMISRIMSQKKQWSLDEYLHALHKELKIFRAFNMTDEHIVLYQRIGFDIRRCIAQMWLLHERQIDKLLEFQALPDNGPCITLNSNDNSEKIWRESFEHCFKRISYIFRDSCYVVWQKEKVIDNLVGDLFYNLNLVDRCQAEEASRYQKVYTLQEHLKTLSIDRDLLPRDGTLVKLVGEFC